MACSRVVATLLLSIQSTVAALEVLGVVLALPVAVGHGNAAGAPHLGHDCINLYRATEHTILVV
jgi:hypothetical protein